MSTCLHHFLIVKEVVAHIIKKVVAKGRLRGIILPTTGGGGGGDNIVFLNMQRTLHSWLEGTNNMGMNWLES